MESNPGAKQAGDLSRFPGGDLVAKGLADLLNHVHSEEALLVLIAEPRLSGLGFDVAEAPDIPLPYEHALFTAIENRNRAGAHVAYNALIARVVAFANSYQPANGMASRSDTDVNEREIPEDRQLE